MQIVRYAAAALILAATPLAAEELIMSNGARLGQFSFLRDDAVKNSEAYWQIYREKLGADEEHKGTHLLGLFMHGPGLLHNNKIKIEKPEDMKGLKIRVPGGYVGELVSALGAAPLFMSSPAGGSRWRWCCPAAASRPSAGRRWRPPPR